MTEAYTHRTIYVDIHGRRIERTPDRYPYSHDAYQVFKRGWFPTDEVTWSDRLFQQDSLSFNNACKTVWGNTGQSFSGRDPADIERFLSLYFQRDVILTGIEQACNMSNGNPYWVFYFRTE